MSHLKLIANNKFTERFTAQDIALKCFGWSKPKNVICPVEPNTMIEVRYHSGNRIVDSAGSFEWYPKGLITHYRTVAFGAIEHIELDQLPTNQVN